MFWWRRALRRPSLLECKSSMRSDRGPTPQHPEPPPAEKGAQSGPPLDLRREARERDAVGVQALEAFLLDMRGAPSCLGVLSDFRAVDFAA